MEILYLLIGIFAGMLIGFLFERLRGLRSKGQAVGPNDLKKNYILREIWEKDQQQLQLLDEKLNLKQKELVELNSAIAAQEQMIDQLREQSQMQEQTYKETQTQMQLQFENLANRLLEEKSKRFIDQNHQQLNQLLDPLQLKIKEFEQKVEHFYHDENKARAALGQQIKQLFELNQLMSEEARNLTQALKGESKVQGNWGEMILERILEQSGLMKDREYKVQKAYRNEEGKILYPDLIIFLPQERHLVIDSKVSLTDYERFCSAETEEERNFHLKAHIQSIKRHISQLSVKRYQQLYELNSLDYVLMFVPIEPAFSLMMQEEHRFFYDALEQNILPVSPSTLLATLRTVANLWRQEQQNRNALEIARQGGLLHDKLVSWVEELELLGQRMTTAQKSFDQVMHRLTTSRGNLIERSERLRELGAKVAKTMPERLLPGE
jgi:DNA recombination protein RmuC